MGLMHPAGLNVFAVRSTKNSGIYAYEQRKRSRFTREQEKQLRANTRPLGNSFVPWVPKSEHLVGRQRKKEETRRKRFSGRIGHSQNRRSSATAYAREEQVTWSQVM